MLHNHKERVIHDLELLQELGVLFEILYEHLELPFLYPDEALRVVIFELGLVIRLYLLQNSIKAEEIYILESAVSLDIPKEIILLPSHAQFDQSGLAINISDIAANGAALQIEFKYTVTTSSRLVGILHQHHGQWNEVIRLYRKDSIYSSQQRLIFSFIYMLQVVRQDQIQ